MTKSLEVISEAVRNPKHPFPKVDNLPKKPLKHRYERRKIKEYLHLADSATGEAAQAQSPSQEDNGAAGGGGMSIGTMGVWASSGGNNSSSVSSGRTGQKLRRWIG